MPRKRRTPAGAEANADMIDKAAIFTELTRRNAARRRAQLPLLDMRDEV